MVLRILLTRKDIIRRWDLHRITGAGLRRADMASRLTSGARAVAGMDDRASRCCEGPLLVLLVLLVLRIVRALQ